MNYGWRPYVPVAKRREQTAKKMNKLRKKGMTIEPISIEGRKITRTFWGNAWCQHIESFSDYENRLPRGRTYARNGSVCHLSVQKGKIEGIVSGSELYNIRGEIKPLSKNSWQQIKTRCSGHIGSVLELLQGKLSDNIMSVVTDSQHGLFPSPKEIQLSCDCPDWADLCKHLAAVLYGIGARLDESPELLFALRGVDHNELISTDIQLPSTGKRRRISGDIADVFGVELSQNNEASEIVAVTKSPRATPPRSTSVKKSTTTRKSATLADKKIDPFNATGPAVRRLRQQLDMNKTQFATLIGVSLTTITHWEGKRGKLSLKDTSLNALSRLSKLSSDAAWKRLKKGGGC
ncbi:MAG: putative Zn finger protein [Candidatus Endobugula sp.]|jgi:uncharacterized Zn finger protein